MTGELGGSSSENFTAGPTAAEASGAGESVAAAETMTGSEAGVAAGSSAETVNLDTPSSLETPVSTEPPVELISDADVSLGESTSKLEPVGDLEAMAESGPSNADGVMEPDASSSGMEAPVVEGTEVEAQVVDAVAAIETVAADQAEVASVPAEGKDPSEGQPFRGANAEAYDADGNLFQQRPEIPEAELGTNHRAEAQKAQREFRDEHGITGRETQAHHWTQQKDAADANIDPDTYNENMSAMNSRNSEPATQLLVDESGGPTTYHVDGGSTYGNEHSFADHHVFERELNIIDDANPNADPKERLVEAGRVARWKIEGTPGPDESGYIRISERPPKPSEP